MFTDVFFTDNNTFRFRSIDSRFMYFFRVITVLLWGGQLVESDADIVCYLFLLTIIGISFYINWSKKIDKDVGLYENVIINIFSGVFSSMVAFSNYELWMLSRSTTEIGFVFNVAYKFFLIYIFFAGGFWAFKSLFFMIASNIERLTWKENYNTKMNPLRVFFICFSLLVVTRTVVLYFCQYPGVLTADSIWQMSQVLSGNYSNHHPYFHTICVKGFVMIGMNLFGEINAAVAVYTFFQIVFTSVCFSLAVSTMARLKTPRWIIVLSIIFYAIMPYHIMYAVSMWKDVMFGCFVLCFIVFSLRYLYSRDCKFLDLVILTISSIGVCLFRSNGFFVFVIMSFFACVLWRLKYKRIILVFSFSIVISFILKHAFLSEIGVVQPDAIESLSIPAQQISRVVQEGNQLNDWERETLGSVIEIEKIPERYDPFFADPIKNSVREKGNQQALVDEKLKYIKLYFTLGIKYPGAYIRAWIDETKGYWNAGYKYWRWLFGVSDNTLGLKETVRSETLFRTLNDYLGIYERIQGFRVFISIGVFVWINMIMLMSSLLRRDKIGVFISLPTLTVLFSLLIATPVFCEFRYIYSLFCAIPIIIVIVLRPHEQCFVEVYRKTK